MKSKKILKSILLISITCIFSKTVSFAVDSSIVDKSIIKDLDELNNDGFNTVIETSDNSVVAVGGIFINHDSPKAMIAKYDNRGNKQWIKNFGESNYNAFNSVVETSDKGIVTVGYSDSTNAGFTNNGLNDAIIVKYDKDGNQLWVKNFGGSNYDTFNSVVETSDKGIVVVGYNNFAGAGLTNNNLNDAVIVKYDKDGNQLWVKNFGDSYIYGFTSIIETSDKDLIAVGTSIPTHNSTDAVIVKCDKEGNELWVKRFNRGIGNIFSSVIETKSGDIIAIAQTCELLDDEIDTLYFSSLVKYDKDGNKLSTKSFSRGFFDLLYSIKETVSNDFVMVGISMSVDMKLMESSYYSILLYYNENYENIFEQINKIESNSSAENLSVIRESVNKIPEGIFKEHFQNRLDKLNVSDKLERKTSSANLDIYIKSENVLILSLDTNSVTFEDFSGIEDVEKTNAVNISINSSLPYQLNAYLPTEIQNSDKTNTMDKQILNIKENSETDYKKFANINETVVLKDNCPAGNNLVHGIDIKLKGGIAHEKDVYKTTIKFEAEQK